MAMYGSQAVRAETECLVCNQFCNTHSHLVGFLCAFFLLKPLLRSIILIDKTAHFFKRNLAFDVLLDSIKEILRRFEVINILQTDGSHPVPYTFPFIGFALYYVFAVVFHIA